VTRLRAYLLVALAACSWGTWRYILLWAERLAPGLDARVESAVVMAVMTVFSFVLLGLEGEPGPRPRALRTWMGVAWLGVADALNVMLLFAAYGHTSVAIAVTTHYLAPLIVAALAPLILRERSRGAWLAVGGAIGLALLLRPWSDSLGPRDVTGAAAGAGSALFYASNVLVNKRLIAGGGDGRGKFTATTLMAFHGIFATPLLVALAPAGAFHALTLPAFLVLVLGGIGPGALGGIFFIRALENVRVTHASTLTLLEPLVAVGIAMVFLGERLAPISWLGALCVLSCAGAVAYVGQQA
jgi:drug/metabolite transporter (DMT)-like permease